MEITTSLLRSVEKPGRYFPPFILPERQNPDTGAPKILIVFPDLFEIAQSHEGIRILFHLFRKAGALVDYGMAVKGDMERHVAECGRMESLLYGLDWRSFDLICVSFQYQLQFPTLVRLLDLAHIPLYAKDRGHNDPILMAGGPVMCNPEPVRAFFDAVYIGEVEPKAAMIVETLLQEKTRAARALRYHTEIPLKRVIQPLLEDASQVPEMLPIFGQRTIHDRYVVEIQRGCTRGCRFCLAGMIYRPHRERSAAKVLEILDERVLACGYQEAGLLSLSAADHNGITSLIKGAYAGRRREFSVSLPSLRPETLTDEIVRIVGSRRKAGFTLAPESGSERLRRVINKGNTTEDLIRATAKIFGSGWTHLKLYFMLGLPTEQEKDIDETIALVGEIARIARNFGRKVSVTASFSTFVPQPFTPFQWEGMADPALIKSRQQRIMDELKKYANLKIDWHDSRISHIEAVTVRSGSNFAQVIETVGRRMKGLQSWDDTFEYDLWLTALKEAGLDPAVEAGPRDLQQQLPYEPVDMGISREFLQREREKAFAGELSPDCAREQCLNCGVCDFKTVQPVKTAEAVLPPREKRQTTEEEEAPKHNRGNAHPYFFKYDKTGRAITLGHLDFVEFLIKGMLREGFSILYSEGFNPSPRFSLISPLSLGIEAQSDWGVVWFTQQYDSDVLRTTLNTLFAGTGISFTMFREVPREEVKPLEALIRNHPAVPYHVIFTDPRAAESFARSIESAQFEPPSSVYFTHPGDKGAVLKKFEGIEARFHLIRLPLTLPEDSLLSS